MLFKFDVKMIFIYCEYFVTNKITYRNLILRTAALYKCEAEHPNLNSEGKQ